MIGDNSKIVHLNNLKIIIIQAPDKSNLHNNKNSTIFSIKIKSQIIKKKIQQLTPIDHLQEIPFQIQVYIPTTILNHIKLNILNSLKKAILKLNNNKKVKILHKSILIIQVKIPKSILISNKIIIIQIFKKENHSWKLYPINKMIKIKGKIVHSQFGMISPSIQMIYEFSNQLNLSIFSPTFTPHKNPNKNHKNP